MDKWNEIDLESILIDFESGKRPKGGVIGIRNGIPSLGGEHLNPNGLFNFKNIKYVPENFANNMKKGHIKLKDILIVKDGATTGKISFVDKNFPFSNAVINEHLFRCHVSEKINSKFVFYFLYSGMGQKRILSNFKGTAQGGINTSFAPNTLIPMAPINEQNRIVEKIEELFSDLDKATEDLKKTQEQLKIYRQAVLKAAFEGKLTNHEKHINKNIKRFGKHIKIVSGNTPKGINNIKAAGEIPFFKISDMNTFGNKIYMKKANIMLAGKNINEMKIRIYPKGTVIFPKRGGAILTNKKRILFQDSSFDLNTMGVIPNDKIISKYLYYWFLKLNLGTIYDGSSVPQINNKNIVHLKIPIPELEIQNKIIQEIESRLSVCDKVEKTVEQNLSKIKYLRQSILKKAFEGKLVPQDPNDLPAGELLKQIKIKKDKMSKNGK
jgi:type I restriction enzyme S subunit